MNDVTLQIALVDAKGAAGKETTLEGRLRAAMRATHDHWMVKNDNERFQAAIAAVYLLSDEVDQGRIIMENNAIRALGSAVDGIPVNFEAVDLPDDPIGLLKIWHETGK